MSHVAGIDVGTRTTRALILEGEDRRILGRAAVVTGHDLSGAARRAYAEALAAAACSEWDVAYVASTGYGRYQVPFRDVQITEITCHAKGAHWTFPGTRSVLDVGAMNCRAMRVGDRGRVLAFRMNDKCASGTGRFLERVARGLEVELEAIGELSLHSKDPQPISSICAVLAESEVINQVTEGRAVEDILRGTHDSIAGRIATLLRQVGVEPEVTLTGGVTKNVGMVRALEDRLGVRLNVSPDADYMGALGAALLASDRHTRLLSQAA